jgi:HPt (histidine-containing phosphotransfer) domain-containing protein
MSQVIDYDNLNMLKEVIGDDLQPILNSFLEITPDLMSKLSIAIESGIASDVQHHAHTLKGSAANVGATVLPELSYALETMGKQGDLSDAKTQFEKIQVAYEALSNAIQEYISSQF